MKFDLHAAVAALSTRLPNLARVLPLVHAAPSIAEGMMHLMPGVMADLTAAQHDPLEYLAVAKDLAGAWQDVIAPALVAGTDTPAARITGGLSPDDQARAKVLAGGAA